jgi:PadR family transcriptional regulator PadR
LPLQGISILLELSNNRKSDKRGRFAARHFFAIIEEMPRPNYLGEFELLAMLAVIRLGEGAYGVPISREIEQQTGRDVAFGTVYATLERLQAKGFVHSALGDATPERGGRAKRFFRVTATGLRTVQETKRSLVRLWQELPELEGGVA